MQVLLMQFNEKKTWSIATVASQSLSADVGKKNEYEDCSNQTTYDQRNYKLKFLFNWNFDHMVDFDLYL